MNKQTQFYYEQLIHAILDVDIDIQEDASLEDISDVCHTFAFEETLQKYGSSDEINLVDDKGTVNKLINLSFFNKGKLSIKEATRQLKQTIKLK